MPQYPIISFLVRYGSPLAVVLSLVPVVAGLYLAIAGAAWLYLVGGIVIGAIAYVVIKSYVELVCLIADMLLPK